MQHLTRRRVAFAGTFSSIFALFAWACAATGTSGGFSDDGGTGEDADRVSCAAPKAVCSGSCVDTQTNDENCGACGKKCGQGEACAEGKCVVECPPESTKCSVGGKDICVNAASDNTNCGGCGQKCASGYVCSAGKCDVSCTVGYSACSGKVTALDGGVPLDASSDAAPSDAGSVATPFCAKLTDDIENCGTCGNRCTAGKKCTSGVCCDSGQGVCSGVCTSLSTDVFNCGTCGKVCPVSAPMCINGGCFSHYTTVGIEQNVPEATATLGWTQCYKEQYNGATSLTTIQIACSKPNVMVVCRQVGQPNFQLIAQAPRTEVFLDTGDGQTAKHEANGVSWYWSNNRSIGFAPAGVAVDRSSCDFIDSYANSPQVGTGQGDKRMCIHTGGGNTTGGWRCGRDNGLGAGWERIMFHANN